MLIALITLLAVLAYTWVAYPVIVLGLMRRRSGAVAQVAHREDVAQAPETLPAVAVLFSAHNEEAVIRQRLENLAAAAYPAGKLSILAGIDGGGDRTAAIATEWAASHHATRVVMSEHNHGKTAMLNRLVAQSDAPVLVFTDANTVFASDALIRLVMPLVDPHIGGVCGRLKFVESLSAHRSGHVRGNAPGIGLGATAGLADETDERTYWDLETRMKAAESCLDSCLGANGAIYAIRRELFPQALPDNVIVDDFVIGMKVREQGYRMVYEPAALAVEELPGTVGNEWRRRVRIGTGAYQALVLCGACLRPRYGLFAWMFWSHKVLRWFSPHVGLAALGCVCWWLLKCGRAAAGLPSVLPFVVVAGAVLAVIGSVLGWVWRRSTKRGMRLLRMWSYFLAMQLALFAGFLRFCRGNLQGTWTRTERR